MDTATARSIALASLLGLFCAAPICAEDFRQETDIFVAKDEEPVAQTLTLFVGDVVYDFLQKHDVLTAGQGANSLQEITIFDRRRGVFVLLEPERRVKTSLNTEELLEFVVQMQARAQQRQAKDFFEPDFDVAFDADENVLTLGSRRLTYRCQAVVPKYPSAVYRYHQFADWYARLNAIRRNSIPPFGRLALNRELALRKLIPAEVERTMVVPRALGDRKYVVRSRHISNWRLSNTDRKRVEEAGSMRASFQPVGFQQYRATDGK